MSTICRRVAQIALVSAVLSLAGREAQAQTYVFGNASYSAPGLNSTSPPQGNAAITSADFNGDGIPDVVILGSTSGGQVLSIFLGGPDGSFAPRVDYSVQATGFTVGDFNGDGKLDVIVVTYGYTVTGSILLGNGDGTLRPSVPLNQNIGNGYSAAASGDFNGDGKLDLLLLTPDFGSGATMAILLGNGDGSFQPSVTYSVPVAPYIVVGDFNHDGKPDIAISGGISGSGEVSILINNGDGTFKSPANYSISGNVQALAAADLNADGHLDLVVPTGGSSAGVSVLRGNGDGTFANPVVYASNLLSIYSTSIAVADFNGDGKLDVALTNSVGPTNAVAIVLGNGDGTFQNPPLLYISGLLPAGVVTLDVNGDGKPDLAVAGGYGVTSYFSLTTLINRGDGSFANPVSFPVLQFPYSAVTGDFNGDGKADIATTSFTPTGGVSVLLGKGDGTFQPHLDSPTGQSPTAIVAGDFNGDGKLDLVVADSSPTNALLSTLIGSGDGTFQNKFSQTVPGILGSLAIGDFNGDGKLDMAAIIQGTSAVSIFLGHGDGTFAAPAQYPTGPMLLSPPYHNVLVGDFNGDGKLDLAAATDKGIAILLGNGNGTFQPFSLVPSLFTPGPGDDLLALADFNGDGKLDVVKSTQTGIINVALGNGDGTFQQALGFQIPSILNTESAVVSDFNGDGKLDLAFASQSSDVVTILFGSGDGTFKGHIEYSVPSVSNNVNFMLAADFNGDGALDMALADFGNTEVSVFVNRPIAAFAPRALNFANQGITTTSPEQSVTLTNAGAAQLAITSIAAIGDFSETNDCGPTLNIGKACMVRTAFAPTADGVRSGMLSFTDNASVVPQAILLSGIGTGSGFLISVAPGSSASQTVTAGQTASYSLVFTPEGGFNGTITLTCSGAPTGANCITTPASFASGGPSATTATITVATTPIALMPLVPKLMPAQPVSLRLRFNLRWVGRLLGTLLMLALLAITAGRARRPAWLTLTAATMLVLIWAGCGGGGGSVSTGPPPAPSAAISSDSLIFSSQNQGNTSPAQSVTLTNAGNAALSITGISVAGTNPGDFRQTNSCGSSVVAGGNCSIGVTFSPTATGSRSATLSIGDNANGSPQLVNLAGTGVPPATPPGTYTIMITANSGAVTQTKSLMLTVR
jgi:VCBS repeat protein/centrosomal CEP192-like protein